MQAFLIAARALHFGAAISLAGTLAFACIIAEPAFRRSGLDDGAVLNWRRKFGWLAWASLALALVSGGAWLVGVASEISGKPLPTAFSQGILGVVLTRTEFGRDWLLRSILAGLLALCLASRSISPRRASAAAAWVALALAAALLASLAWAGHGAATPGPPGNLHLAADCLHLLAAGLWLGTLAPLALLLTQAAHGDDRRWLEVARFATRRFSRLAVASVTILLAGGLINTWFLAGSVPALIGTEYGLLLLGKIALFIAMLMLAAVNLIRFAPRLAGIAVHAAAQTIAQLRRNALLESLLGLGVVGIVGVLGRLPPGLHTEPGWPFPFRVDFAALPLGSKILLGVAAVLFCTDVIGTVAAAAAGRYRTMAAFGASIVLPAAIAWIAASTAMERAYPTSFYAPARPYDAASVSAGAQLYAADCAACHGAGGAGNGPAAGGLSIRPANLTEAHLFAHSPGDLFWWVSEGRGHGAMPGFAAVMTPSQRWDVINFIRARAAGMLARGLGPAVASAAYPVPDFAFETDGKQQTLSGILQNGPVLLVLFDRSVPFARLRQLATDQPRLGAAGLQVVAIPLAGTADTGREDAGAPPLLATVSPQVASTLALFRSPADGVETEVLLDRGGNIRARWDAAGPGPLPDATTLVGNTESVARSAVAAPAHVAHHQ